jgi:hypothetical protein
MTPAHVMRMNIFLVGRDAVRKKKREKKERKKEEERKKRRKEKNRVIS